MTTKTKALRWPAFAALSPEEKHERFVRRFYDEFLKGECARFTEEITPELVSMVLRFWHVSRRQVTSLAVSGRVIAIMTREEAEQEALLRQMRAQPDLFFGCRKDSRWEPGLMAVWRDYFDRTYDGVDAYLIVTDFRGEDMFAALDFLHGQGCKDTSQDFLEKRIARLFPES